MAFSLAMTGMLPAQYITISVNPSTPNFGRPVYDAVEQIQNLTTIPINYEDLPYNYAGDVRGIVPKGGSFSVNVPVDPATGKLTDAPGVGNALNTIITAAQAAGIVPGTFSVDSSQPGVFFVEPSLEHNSSGSMVTAQAALATPVTVSFQQAPPIQVLKAIFLQIAQKTGARFEPGAGTLALTLPTSKVTITASNEPAKYVLARLLASVYHLEPGKPPVSSYIALFEPQQRYYMFNIQWGLAARSPSTASSPGFPQQPPKVGRGLGYQKKSN